MTVNIIFDLISILASLGTFIVALLALRIWKAKKKADIGDEIAITAHKIHSILLRMRNDFQDESHVQDCIEMWHKDKELYKELVNLHAKTKVYFPNIYDDVRELIKISNLVLHVRTAKLPTMSLNGVDYDFDDIVYGANDEDNIITKQINLHVQNIENELRNNLNRW